ncbi:transcriptional regulatory [Fusarium beomiforme]|uniref:Transcriptional regulatory n=1 Tax=Fusarium beomiforme TaxID=44412 RepID=A0A9P5A5U5_9HYPO|nr:transcriptional regulatory [Fusarium beomiforme]
MSSLHLDYISSGPEGRPVASPETLCLYGKALRSMRKRLAQPSEDTTKTALVCCILFYCCESTIGDQKAALQHLSNGRKLLISAQQETAREESEDMKRITIIFERLDMQASFFEDDRVPVLALPELRRQKADCDAFSSEGKFHGVQDAQQQLVRLQAWLYHFINKNVEFHEDPIDSLSLDIMQEKSALVQEYNSWFAALEELEHREQHDDQTSHGLRTLLVQFHICRMVLESKFPQNQQVFGASPNPVAHHILDLAETLLEHAMQLNALSNATKTPPRRSFSLETGVVAPLFALALKCSDNSVATRATWLLASSNRREGLYEALTMSQIINELRKSREGGLKIEEKVGTGMESMSPLEYHIPEEYYGGGIDKLLWSMRL